MKKLLFLSLILGLSTVTTHANPAQMEVNPGMMMGGGMPEMDIFAHVTGYDPDNIFIDAHQTKKKIVAALSSLTQDDQDLEPRLIAHAKIIDQMKKEVMMLQGQEALRRHATALRRYEKLSQACIAEPFQVHDVRTQLDLIDRHHELIRERFELQINQLAAQNALQKSESPYEQIPKFQEYLQNMEPRLAEIQKELVTVEKLLLKDERTWGKKYGPLILGAVGAVVVLVGGTMLISRAAESFNEWLSPQSASHNSLQHSRRRRH